jgi:hypothetical protein
VRTIININPPQSKKIIKLSFFFGINSRNKGKYSNKYYLNSTIFVGLTITVILFKKIVITIA